VSGSYDNSAATDDSAEKKMLKLKKKYEKKLQMLRSEIDDLHQVKFAPCEVGWLAVFSPPSLRSSKWSAKTCLRLRERRRKNLISFVRFV
jgi:hypothetical protein